jgi:hypothetical protein
VTNQLADIPPLLSASERFGEDIGSHLVGVAVVQFDRTRNNLLMEPSQVNTVCAC